MKIIAGLGNPGKKYENTRHNIGFITIDRLAEKHGIKVNRIKHKALTGEGMIGSEKVLLVKPQTFMNLSGESIRDVLAYYRIPDNDLFVIYDDVDIATGSFRIRAKGSAGGHNGMKSIIYNIGSDDFPRFRVGIGSEHKAELVDYVLGGFDKESAEKTRNAVDKVVEALECAITSGIDKAMNEYNIKPRTQKKQLEQSEKLEKREEKETQAAQAAQIDTGAAPEKEQQHGNEQRL